MPTLGRERGSGEVWGLGQWDADEGRKGTGAGVGEVGERRTRVRRYLQGVLFDYLRWDEAAPERVVFAPEKPGAQLGGSEGHEGLRHQVKALDVTLLYVPPAGDIHCHHRARVLP